MSTPRASLLLSAYEQGISLDLVMAGLLTQTEQNFELLLCEDDEDPQTAALVEKYKALAHFPIFHFRQPHKDMRKCRILNEAILASRGETLIFLDGDCIPHKDYVSQHLALQENGRYVAGRRVDLSPGFTQKLSAEAVASGFCNASCGFLWALWLDSLKKDGSTPFHRAYLVRTPWLRRVTGLEQVVDMKGCNFSVAKKDMLAINGFDERYEGYGREDTDIELRLQHLGLKIKSAKNLCLQFHVWHERRGFTPINEDLLREVTESQRVEAVKGLREHAKHR